MWLYDDEIDYKSETKRGFIESVRECIEEGAFAGSEIGGRILGIPGKIIGGINGGTYGAIGGFFEKIFG